ncbi:MAG: DoxX family protein [Opitutales bacterium]
MDLIKTLIQIIIPLGILNVWLVRPKQATSYRGKNAASLKEEFAAYGLPEWSFYTVGALKLSAAAMLLLGFLLPPLVPPAAALMAVLMLGAVVMHAKVGDPAGRYLPAAVMLFFSLVLLI